MGKGLFKNKKFIIAIAIIITIVVVGIVFLILKKEDAKEIKNHIENEYTMVVKINPSVKLTFKESYDECVDENNKKSICSSKEENVVSYELINEDAKKIYKEVDFVGKNIFDAISIICDTAKDSGIKFNTFEITSDWKDIPSEEEVIEKVIENSKYQEKLTVSLMYNDGVKDYNPSIKTFKVVFDSNGGSKIISQVINENEKITSPSNPTKSGYKFVEWQLNNKKFDFDSKITKDLTLKAKWEKLNTSENNSNNNNSNNGSIGNSNEEIITRKFIYKNPVFATYFQPKDLIVEFDSKMDFELIITGPKSILELSDNELRNKISLSLDYSNAKVGVTSLNVLASFSYSNMSATITPKSLPVKISKGLTSSVDKINLNENIKVEEKSYGYCGDSYYIAASNIKEVFGNYYDGYMVYFNDSSINFDTSNLIYDESKTNEAYAKMEAAAKKKTKGFKNIILKRNGNKLTFQFGYLEITGKYGYFSEEYNLKVANYRNELSDITKSLTLVAHRCGSLNEMVLNEALCSEYNLTCDRW